MPVCQRTVLQETTKDKASRLPILYMNEKHANAEPTEIIIDTENEDEDEEEEEEEDKYYFTSISNTWYPITVSKLI